MATIKITDLPNLLSGSVVTGSDVIPIVDESADITKKITVGQLAGAMNVGSGGGGAGIPTGIGNCVEAVQDNSTCTQAIVGGKDNCIDASGSVQYNEQDPSNISTCSGYNFIGAGFCNKITGSFLSSDNCYASAGNQILGGALNTIEHTHSSDYLLEDNERMVGGNIINGGFQNCITTVSGFYAPGGNIIGGGWNNKICGATTDSGYYLQFNTIAGGTNNVIQDTDGDGGTSHSTIGGGQCNTVSKDASTVSGGYNNTASGYCSTVSGGYNNTASGDYSTESGGYCNTASSTYSTVGGGCGNTASGENSTIGGGQCNTTSGENSTIGGGQCNTASGYYSTVGGGQNHTASGEGSTISGGSDSTASACYSTISGGYGHTASGDYSTVSGGYNNTASGNYSAILGGSGNTAECACSFIAGHDITARTTSSLHVNNLLLETGSIPTSDPGIPGMLFIAGGALKVSGCIA